MTIKEKILSFLDAQAIKKTDFFEAMGLSPSNFKGTAKQTELGGEKIAKILTSYPQLSAEWLMRGVGDMLLNKANISTSPRELSTGEVNIQPSQPTDRSPLSPFVERLMDKLDSQEAISRKQAEEIGRLKARIEELERREIKNTPAPYVDTHELATPIAAEAGNL